VAFTVPRLSGPAAVGWDRWVSRSTQDVSEYWNGTVEARKIYIGSSSLVLSVSCTKCPASAISTVTASGTWFAKARWWSGGIVRRHRMPDVYDVARIGFIDDFRMFGGVTG